MALPYDLVGLVFVLVVGGLMVAWWAAPALAAGLPRKFTGETDPLWRIRRVRRTVLVLLALVVAGAFGLRAAGAPLAPGDEPLGFGHAWGGDDPLLLGELDASPQGEIFFAYAPGAEIRTGITLANDGNVPLTVTGLEPPPHPVYVRSYELRLPPGAPTPDLPLVYPDEGASWTSEPFRAFEIQAHGEVGVGLAVTLNACPEMSPVPTLAPGASLMPAADPRFTRGFGAVDALRVRYTAFGISRTATVTLPMSLNVVTSGVPECLPA